MPDSVPRSWVQSGQYGRMYRNLPAWRPEGRSPGECEAWIARAGLLHVEAEEEAAHPDGDNPSIPAGYTYFGQLLAHDLSFDPTPIQARADDPDRMFSYRTPRLDLDCLYGRGPELDPHLYERDLVGPDEALRGLLLREGRAGQNRNGLNPGEADLPRQTIPAVRTNPEGEVRLRPGHELFVVHPEDRFRTHDGRREQHWARLGASFQIRGHGKGQDAMRWQSVGSAQLFEVGGAACIADARNDDNLIVAQLDLAFRRLHNRFLRREWQQRRGDPRRAFDRARDAVRWTYQWILMQDFLPRLVDPERLAEVRSRIGLPWSSRHYRWSQHPYIPIEFAAGVFRIGHSMARLEYRLNDLLRGPLRLFGGDEPRRSLAGGKLLPARWSLQWDLFLGEGEAVQASRRLDRNFSPAFSTLPEHEMTLLDLDLLRAWRLGLPSGQAVARAMGLSPRPPVCSSGEDPLLVYVLEEARDPAEGGGRRLGTVGSIIVSEVFLGILSGDPSSFVRVDPAWTPWRDGWIPRAAGQPNIGLLDVIRAADLPISREDLERYLQTGSCRASESYRVAMP